MGPEVLREFGVVFGKASCHATCHYFFASLDADALSRALGHHALGETEPGHVAIDGKTLCGSWRGERKALHVVSAFAVDLGAVIGDLSVEHDANENALRRCRCLRTCRSTVPIVTSASIFAQCGPCAGIFGGLADISSSPPSPTNRR